VPIIGGDATTAMRGCGRWPMHDPSAKVYLYGTGELFMKYNLILIASLLTMPLIAIAETSPNYCLDPETNATWSKMLSESPQDNLVAKLFALRVGLCELVRIKAISLERATDIFEEAREEGVGERMEEEERHQRKKSSGA